MNAKPRLATAQKYPRSAARVFSLRDISLSYEGRNEKIIVRSPDVSARGMFINTGRPFPEGAVLNVQFRLALSGVQVRARCEVRYCIPGEGVGVEFIGLSSEAAKWIEREVELIEGRRPRKKVHRINKKPPHR